MHWEGDSECKIGKYTAGEIQEIWFPDILVFKIIIFFFCFLFSDIAVPINKLNCNLKIKIVMNKYLSNKSAIF